MLKESKFIKDWSNFLENNKRYSINTIESYIFDIHDLLKFNLNNIKKTSISQYISEDIYSWLLNRKNEKNISNRSNHRALSSLKNFLNFLKKNKINIPDELMFIESPKFNNKLPRAISIKEIKFSNILNISSKNDWTEIQDKAILMIMYGCGLRISEVLNLKLNDIDFDNMTLKITHSKNSKQRIVPIIKYALNSLIMHFIHCPFLNIEKNSNEIYASEIHDYKSYKNLLKKISLNEYLFFCKNGNILTRNYFAIRLKSLLPLYNLPYGTSSHSFRHSFATHLLENGANIKDIQNLLGHLRLSSSEVYTKVSNNLLRKMYSLSHPKNN